jgi:arginase
MNNQILLTPLFLDEPVAGLEDLAAPGWSVNRPALPDGDRLSRLGVVHEAIADWVQRTLANGERPVSIAGDCCTAIGVLAGLQRGGVDPTLIWFDAHGDFNTPATTPSGFLGGMPLAMIAGRGDLTLPAAVGLAILPERKILLTDGRDLDPPERAALNQSAVVHRDDPADLLTCDLPAGPLYIHFDVDVVALNESPAQNYPAGGGPSAAVLHTVFERLAATQRVAAVSMSTWNPAFDPDGRSRATSMALLQTLVGNLSA